MYTNNKEYRQAIRDFCKMNCQNIIINEEIDDESRDEQLFDILASQNTMNFIYEKTKDNLLWQKIYDKAAEKVFSMNREIGLSILFSYDYFWDFKQCWDYFYISLDSKSSLEKFDENNKFYKSLYSNL
jgi:hypothetical protein